MSRQGLGARLPRRSSVHFPISLGAGKVGSGHFEIGPQIKGATEASNRLVHQAQLAKGGSQIVVRVGIIRAKLQCPVVAGDGLDSPALVVKGDPQIGLRLDKVRIDLQGVPETVYRLVEVSLLRHSDAELVPVVRRRWLEWHFRPPK